MSERIEEARGEIENGKPKRALRLLWREKVEASVRGDRATLLEILGLARAIAAETGGSVSLDARGLASSAENELGYLEQRRQPPAAPRLAERLDDLEARLLALQVEVREVRALASSAPEPAEPAPTPAPGASVETSATWPGVVAAEQERQEQPPVAQPPPPSPLPPSPPPPRPPRVPRAPRKPLWEQIGAGALAWVGGLVTLLGVVFIFVLAVNRGWVGPELRVGIGALVSVGLFGAAIVLRRRYGNLYAALGAAGAAVGGAYATLFAATALYGFLSEPAALLVAGGIAAAGVATALAWGAQITAVLGLVGAMVGPTAIEGEPSTAGTAFVAVLLVAAVGIAVQARWLDTAVVAGLASVPQIAALLITSDVATNTTTAFLTAIFALAYLAAGVAFELRPAESQLLPEASRVAVYAGVLAGIGLVVGTAFSVRLETPVAIFVLVGVFWALFLAGAVAYQVALGSDRLQRTPVTLLAASVGTAFPAVLGWFPGERAEGFALLVPAAAYLAVLPLLRGRGQRDLTSLLWAAGFAFMAVAVGDLLSGSGRALAWAAQGAFLAWLSARTRELRLQYAALAYVVLAAGQAFFDAPPSQLLQAQAEPAVGVLGHVFAAAATAVLAVYQRHRILAAVAWSAAGGFALYAASLGLLELFQRIEAGPVAGAFERGHASVTSLWAVVGLVVLVVAFRRASYGLHGAGLVVLSLAALKGVVFDLSQLSPTNRSYSFLAVAALLLVAGMLCARYGERFHPTTLHPFAPGFAVLGAVLAVGAVVELLDGRTWGIDREGGGLLLVAAAYGLCAGLLFRTPRLRDLTTLLWAIALGIAAAAAPALLDGNLLTVAWAAAAAALAWLASRSGEERFAAASLVYLLLAAVHTLALQAPPSDLFVAAPRPALGVPSVLAVGTATVALARYAPRPRAAALGGWAAGVIFLYAASLAILGFLQLLAADDAAAVANAFERGHTAVSALWGVTALALLALGLSRRRRALRLGGLALFAAALAKIFVHDLASLSSLARALSFLVVGVVLLLAAFVYQRLTERLDDSGAAA